MGFCISKAVVLPDHRGSKRSNIEGKLDPNQKIGSQSQPFGQGFDIP